MKLYFNLFIFTVILIATTGLSSQKTNLSEHDDSLKKINSSFKSKLAKEVNFGKIPLYFIENKGQVNKQAEFYARASRYTLWMTKKGLIFDSFKRQKTDDNSKKFEKKIKCKTLNLKTDIKNSKKNSRDVSRMVFVGADKNVTISAIDSSKFKVNHFIGNDKSKWQKNIPTSMAVLYTGVYKNIDMKVYGIEKQIEYDWIVKPGGDPSFIKFQYKDVKGTRIDKDGNLLIKTKFGELIHKKPVSYQFFNKKKIEVEADFKKLKNNTYAFKIGCYDKNKQLIIDPVVLAYSTYLGGSSRDQGFGITVDSSGCAYITGYTTSTDFPTLNPYMTGSGVYVAFVTKLSSNGNSLEYSTYLGGNSTDWGNGIAVDNSGCAYVTGYTFSTNFPTLTPYMSDSGGELDVFLTKLSSNGSSLEYSTYLGGSSYDYGYGIAVDSFGCAYVTGYTSSTDFPTRNPYMTDSGGGLLDVFITKLSSDGKSLEYSTYLGGSSDDYGYGIAVDSSGSAYVTGYTSSTDFPTHNPYMDDPGDGAKDAFVTKLSSDGSSLEYSTYLGGSGYEEGKSIAVSSSGRAYVTGFTNSIDFPILNQYQIYQNNTDAFVTKLSQNGSSLEYSTYLGGSGSGGDYGYSIAVDSSGSAYVTGLTSSTDFPTYNHNIIYSGGQDAFVTKFSSTGSSLEYSTYLGGSIFDPGYGIAVDGSGCAYVTGYTSSTDFPTLNPYMTDPGDGWDDVFVTKLIYLSINITSPNGGESLQLGNTHNITWSSSCLTNNVKIMLLKDGALVGLITKNIDPTSGTYSWTTGSHSGGTAAVGTGYTIKIREQGGVSYTTDDFSDASFTLTSNSHITIATPNGGEDWHIGATENITWSASNLTNNVKILLLKDGALVGLIAKNVNAEAGTYSWAIGNSSAGTAVAGTGYTIKIREQGGVAFTTLDSSDASFELSD